MKVFEGKVVVVAGGAQGIGRCIAERFAAAGARVCVFDLQDNPCFVGNLANESDLQAFWRRVVGEYGHVNYLINNAAPLFKGVPDCSWEEFNDALLVGVATPYMLTKLFLPLPWGTRLAIDRLTRGNLHATMHTA